MTETFFGKKISNMYFDFLVCPMSHLLKWRRPGLWPKLEPAGDEQMSCHVLHLYVQSMACTAISCLYYIRPFSGWLCRERFFKPCQLRGSVTADFLLVWRVSGFCLSLNQWKTCLVHSLLRIRTSCISRWWNSRLHPGSMYVVCLLCQSTPWWMSSSLRWKSFVPFSCSYQMEHRAHWEPFLKVISCVYFPNAILSQCKATDICWRWLPNQAHFMRSCFFPLPVSACGIVYRIKLWAVEGAIQGEDALW